MPKLTPKYLAELRRICEAATPGPLFADIRTGVAAIYPLSDRQKWNCLGGACDEVLLYQRGRGEPSAPGSYRLVTAQQEADIEAFAHARNALPALLDAYGALSAQLEADRTAIIDVVNAIESEIGSRWWITEGRGSYEWNDDRYRDEFTQATRDILVKLGPLRKIGADLKDCPKTTDEVVQARIDQQKKIEEQQREIERLKGMLSIPERDLSRYAFENYGNDAHLYNSIHGLETKAANLEALRAADAERMAKLEAMLERAMDALQSSPCACRSLMLSEMPGSALNDGCTEGIAVCARCALLRDYRGMKL